MARTLIVLGLVAAAVGCKAAAPSDPGPPYRAQVLEFRPGADNTFQLALTVADMPGLKDLKHLRGDDVEVLPGVRTTLRTSDCGSPPVTKAGEHELRYDVKNGVVVPRDQQTLVQLSLYRLMAGILGRLEANAGIPLAAFKAGFGLERLRVFHQPVVTGAVASGRATIGLRDNAFVTADDANVLMAFFPAGGDFKTDPAVNQHVAAHEFGHLIFWAAFEHYKLDPHGDDRWPQERAIAGLNEGFADFVSYTYTGATDVLGAKTHDTSDAVHADQRDFSRQLFKYADLRTEDLCKQGHYCIGTVFARSLYQLVSESAARLGTALSAADVLKQVVTALGNVEDHLDADGTLLPAKQDDGGGGDCTLDQYIFGEPKQDYDRDSAMLGGFLQALVKEMPAAEAPLLCEILAREANFGDTAFGPAWRVGVCP